MTATKVDSIASKPMQSNKYSYVHDVQRSVPRVTKRCLFGPPDQTELQKIWKDNLENERQRMINKYGFDVKTEKFVGSQTHGVSQSDTKNCTSSNRLCNNNTKNTQQHKKTSSDFKQTCMTGKIFHYFM